MNTVSFIALSSIAVPVSLYILDYGLWLETGSGNANYIFFQCLAYNVFVATIFLDFLGATLQRDKALRLTVKEERETKKQDQT
jgi:phosphatidylinositol glycan class U